MNLELTQQQKQLLSQKMIQSSEILQMNTQDLELYLRQQALENPLIELEPADELPDRKSHDEERLEWLAANDEQNRIYYSEDYGDEGGSREQWNVAETEENSLAEYVFAQLVPEIQSDRDEDIYYYLTCSLDSRGYLDLDKSEFCLRWKLTEAQADEYIGRLQQTDPAGVGAFDLRECLLIQLKRQGRSDGIESRIVSECLELLGKNQLPAITHKCRCSLEEVQAACDVIRKLNPKPGCGFSSRENLRYIVPDIVVTKFRDYFEILLNDSRYPHLTLNSQYCRMLHEVGDEEVKTYIRDKMNQAKWVYQCIEQRNSTLKQVARAIVEYQHAFFEKGAGYLKPYRQKDLADTLKVHESTISRALRDKYLQCTWGVYPMNYFCSRGFPSEAEGMPETTEKIRQRLQQMIDHEDKKKPLSDQKLADRMQDDGFPLARRTVAKYRSEMGIPDASGRKKY